MTSPIDKDARERIREAMDNVRTGSSHSAFEGADYRRGFDAGCAGSQLAVRHALDSLSQHTGETDRSGEAWTALDNLQAAEAAYRKMHDLHGDDAMQAGMAWDVMRRAGDRAREALTARPIAGETDRSGATRFLPIMGTKQQPDDLDAYARELEQIVAGAYQRADQWRWIANEMGYEPNAHQHPPLNAWLRDRIAKFRALAARPIAGETDRDAIVKECANVVQAARDSDNFYNLRFDQQTKTEGAGNEPL